VLDWDWIVLVLLGYDISAAFGLLLRGEEYEANHIPLEFCDLKSNDFLRYLERDTPCRRKARICFHFTHTNGNKPLTFEKSRNLK
ncbi:MAG: hypothetical protein ACI90V_007814, partial [Bacillariaceae sp.]|jgi:hypothetical protein